MKTKLQAGWPLQFDQETWNTVQAMMFNPGHDASPELESEIDDMMAQNRLDQVFEVNE